MKPGTKPRPEAMKVLQDEKHKDRYNPNAPNPRPGRPMCPQSLDEGARKEWRRIVPELEVLGLLTEIDRADLAAYCSAYGRWMEAERKLKELRRQSPQQLAVLYKTSNGNLIINPLLSVLKGEREACHKFLIEFGMTPSSRTRLTVVPKEDPEEADLRRLLDGG